MKYKNNKIVYEVGDWVIPNGIGHTKNNVGFPTDRVFRVERTSNDASGYYVHVDKSSSNIAGYTTGFENVRPATQEEINKATKKEKIMIGDYEVVFKPEYTYENGYAETAEKPRDIITVGCVSVSKELFLKIGKRAGWL